MWLTLDIGNSAVKGGLFEGPALQQVFRLPSAAPATPDAWTRALQPYLADAPCTRAGISSVVPAATPAVTHALQHSFGLPVEVVRPIMQLPFTLAYETPHTLGADRLAAAAAATVLYGKETDGAPRPVLAIDAGTALTIEVIDADKVYRGGIIAPGPQLLQQALHHGTAQLPEVPLVFPVDLIGRTTQAAIQSGLMMGFVESVRGLLMRISYLLEAPPYTVVTGGWSTLLQTHLDGIDDAAPHLVLQGVRILMDLNPVSDATRSSG